MSQLADEVFHIMFHNRAAMAALNSIIAGYVEDIDLAEAQDEREVQLALYFAGPGRLKRKTPPKWARRAVFFRDNGMCASCGVNLSGLLDALPTKHFDHIIPLDCGGLNDVTNLQLLCQPCNLRKSAGVVPPSIRYRRIMSR